MGLDILTERRDWDEVHAQWSYRGFMDFRRRLAAAAGIHLDAMEGFAPSGGRSWSELNDPIVTLLNHSDCDGEINWTEARALADRIRELVASWPPEDYDHHMALRLCDQLESIADGSGRLVFT